MKIFTTQIWAVDPRQISDDFVDGPGEYSLLKDGVAKGPFGKPVKWDGPKIQARSLEEAKEILQVSGLGYCKLDGESLEIMDEEPGKKVELRDTPWIYHD